MGKCNVIITYIDGPHDERGSTTCISSLLENIPDINGSQCCANITFWGFRPVKLTALFAQVLTFYT